MDIISHGLWGATAANIADKKINKKISPWWATFWGVFPDLFAFTIPFLWLMLKLVEGGSDIPNIRGAELQPDSPWVFHIATTLYNYSHSMIVFLAVFGLVYFVLRRPLWELIGWPLHIIMDIPTHTYQFYPTPALWPLWNKKFSGFSWATPWFMVLNYSVLLLIYALLRLKRGQER